MDSPPKRMTRARAAAQGTAVTTKTTRTAAAKAQSLSTVTPRAKSTSAKRKASDEGKDDGNDESAGINNGRAVRARSGNRYQREDCGRASVRTASGRDSLFGTSSRAAVKASNDDGALAAARTRGCVRKPYSQDPRPSAKKTDKETAQTRVAAGTVSKSVLDKSKTVRRKAVKVKQSGKENESLASKVEETSSNTVPRGLRARPTRPATEAVPDRRSEKERKKPLSPKKVTQMPVSRDRESSEDELPGGDGLRFTAKSPTRMSKGGFIKDNEVRGISMEHGDDKTRDEPEVKPGPGPAIFVSPPRRPPLSPPKETLKSPAKKVGGLYLPGLYLQSRITPTAEKDTQGSSNHFNVLLQSPARRPPSPIKGPDFATQSFGCAVRSQISTKSCSLLQSPAKRAMPGIWSPTQHPATASVPITGSPQMQPIMAAALPILSSGQPSGLLMAEDSDGSVQNLLSDNPFDAVVENTQFSGRLSAVLPSQRDSHFSEQAAREMPENIVPVWTSNAISPETEECGIPGALLTEGGSTYQDQPHSLPAGLVEEAADGSFTSVQGITTEMEVPEEVVASTIEGEAATVESQHLCSSRLRDDIAADSSCNSKSEIESANNVPQYKTVSVSHDGKGRRSGSLGDSLHATQRHSRRSSMGLTPSIGQFGSWSAASPVRSATATCSSFQDFHGTSSMDGSHDTAVSFGIDLSPIKSTLFEDEIVAHSMPQPGEDEVDDMISLEDIAILDEDVALAQKADAMSSIVQQRCEEVANTHIFEETLSEASQEYGDENEMPLEPTHASRERHHTATPHPQPQISFSTTTRVPLKPADNSESSPLKQRSVSARRASSRPAGDLTRSATVMSYSPIRGKTRASILPGGDLFSTPTKDDQRSNAVAPRECPRRNVDRELLRGSTVLVDVHTSEGADASGVFVDLLTQMGAKCVKTWHWNPSGSGDGDSSSSKIGITHVVFKDGGKRTMEKVREAGGVVHCVGVSWVLDCERENAWLDEAPYYLDTSVIPRGGARRRKSMEPKAIANLNGTMISSINKTSEPLRTPKNRRESTLWMHTPPEQGAREGEEDLEWPCALLTPVPKTPAPEAVAKYASEIPATPSSDEDSCNTSPTKYSLLTRTCPLKEKRYHDPGRGILSRDKDEQVVMKLMAARRKSLQFAPKVGSPLARTWD